ncbi:MAG: carboxypeptidase regulatory-like domain-containing protein [Ardenticatenaceae bacterium]|nr:carboxypeptidase regulatory-like domain-containing protein [Ardenticatenaceae bacterium]MCB9443465.1 carboxypeptidase regulatory-like domain-containing protein [Ardenticatenaceae bacterium]
MPDKRRIVQDFLWGICVLLIVALNGRILPAAAQDNPFAIHLEWPNEGETLYAGPSSLLYSVPIKGWVDGLDSDPASVNAHLEVLQGDEVAGELTQPLQPDGTFEFVVTVNPDGSDGRFPAEHLTCSYYCHLSGNLNLPAGGLTLRVTAVTPTNEQAQVERHITVDRSVYTAVPINVLLADNPQQPVAGVKVNASTWLYMWRSRSFSGASNEQGQALIRAEMLTAAPTDYVFRVEPTVVDGVLYEGVTTADLTLLPGETAVTTPLILTVKAHTGQIAGTISGATASLPVWAIRLPSGESYQTVIDQGGFTFAPLPIDRYLLAVDGTALLTEGLSGKSQEVDLLADFEATAEISLKDASGLVLNGRVLDENGTPIPFAWVTPEQVGATRATLPDSGVYTLTELPQESISLLTSAPGYYSRAKRVNLSADAPSSVDIVLTPQPETQIIAWGNGAVVVPAESQAEVSGTTIVLENGWLWGQSDSAQPVVIDTPAVEISLSSGEFALEYLPGKRGWLYVVNGRAQVRQQENAIELKTGQMVNLFNETGLQAVPLKPMAVTALHADQSSPLFLVWEPTLEARIRDRLARVGVSTAQVITFITYFIVLLSLFIVPLLALYWRRKDRKYSVNT